MILNAYHRILVAPDSFKETMSSKEVCQIIHDELLHLYPKLEVEMLPIADGGEGSIDAICSNPNTRVVDTFSVGPNMEKIKTCYGVIDEGKKVIIEVANHVGFTYKKESSTPSNTTTYGIGLTILEAMKEHPQEIYLCLGGSITNDGGCGLASALGIKFYNHENIEFIPTGNTLKEIQRIDTSSYLLKDVSIIGLCDVKNPLYGKNGASYVFAPQKGAHPDMVVQLDQGLTHLSTIYKKTFSKDYSSYEGSGAAGGIGFAVLAFLNGKLQKGIETILELHHFNEKIQNCNFVITGEGKLDHQSMNGKVISGVLNHAKESHVPVIALVGTSLLTQEEIQSYGLSAVYETNIHHYPMDIVKKRCKEDLKEAVKKIQFKNLAI